MWLFGFNDLTHPGFSVKSELETDQDRIGFAARLIPEEIGVEPEEQAPNYLEEMLRRFEGGFPKTIEFSGYARNTPNDLGAQDDPDAALMAWMECEEILFRTLDRHLLGDGLQKLHETKGIDPDAYMKLTMSFQQRRKSRAGSALENRLEQVFTDHGITYTRTSVTENNLKPDFIFSDIKSYHNAAFPQTRLTMLAAKTTCMDRWRQILNEAQRIPAKHLLTLEPSISENQTGEMRVEQVQLVLSEALHTTYTLPQQEWILNVSEFLEIARYRQAHS